MAFNQKMKGGKVSFHPRQHPRLHPREIPAGKTPRHQPPSREDERRVTLKLKDGSTVTGEIVMKTGESILIRTAGGRLRKVPRADVVEQERPRAGAAPLILFKLAQGGTVKGRIEKRTEQEVHLRLPDGGARVLKNAEIVSEEEITPAPEKKKP